MDEDAAVRSKGHKASGDRPGEAATVAEANGALTAVQGALEGSRARGSRRMQEAKAHPPPSQPSRRV